MPTYFLDANKYILLAVIMAASAGLLFGFDTGNIAGALIFIHHVFHTTTLQNEWIVSLTVLGAFLGAATSGKTADVYGRKTLLMFSALLYMSGTLLGTLSASVIQLMSARFILGLAIGISSYVAPLYISEISPARFRGFFVLLNGVAITGGEAIAYGIDYRFSFSGDWRAMFFLGIIPAIILGVGMCFMPRSPRWLVMKGKLLQAKKVLTLFYDPMRSESELQKIQTVAPIKTKLSELIYNAAYRRLLFIGISLGIFQQFFGINVVMYYGPIIFQHAGIQSVSSDILLTFYMGLINTVMTVVTAFVIDHFGRRALLMTGSTIAVCSLGVLSLLFYIGIHHGWQGKIMLGAMITFIIGYCISVGSLFWLIISEIFPLSVRGQAMSIATAIQWLANFAVSLSFLSLLDTIGSSVTFGFFAAVCCLSVVFTYFFIPETKQRSLEEIEIKNSAQIYSYSK